MTAIAETRVTSWRELRDLLEDLSNAGWAFRGQANAEWFLESSLTRYLKTFVAADDTWLSREAKVLNTFQRKAHLLLDKTPNEAETLEWLALMQHHGAPTRLLDFTWSPYVAAFFALEGARADAAIWAIAPSEEIPNLRGFAISKMLRGVLQLGQFSAPARTTAAKFAPQDVAVPARQSPIQGDTLPDLVIGEPVLLNQRMTAQAGTFVVPITRVNAPVEEMIAPSRLFKVVVQTPTLRKDTMDRLYNMNINNATLFPGVDGLARSLAYELEFSWKVDLEAIKRLRERS